MAGMLSFTLSDARDSQGLSRLSDVEWLAYWGMSDEPGRQVQDEA